MIFGGTGGSNTQIGLVFEGETDLTTFLNSKNGYKVENGNVFFEGEFVGRIFKKHGFYKFLEELGINWKDLISKRLLPDDSIFVMIANTVFIIEYKSQQVAGSVDEKLQTCDFKRKQYQKLLSKANIEVEYMYLLSDWFRKPEYNDALNYIHSVHCYYFFNYIPLAKLGLPVLKEEKKN
jgi:hypothetical protein